jgi:hypothetical protein
MQTWFKNRWNEPESRTAVAAFLPTLSAYLTGKIDQHTLLMALAALILMFVFPRTKGSQP